MEENTNPQDESSHDKIAALLEENLKLTKEVHKMAKSIKNFVIVQRVFGIIKILIYKVFIHGCVKNAQFVFHKFASNGNS